MSNLWQRLFNAPPTVDAQFIQDKKGEKFWVIYLEDSTGATFFVSYRGRRVAHVYLEWHDPDIRLVDIVIDERDYRNRGIGTTLLEYVTEFAQKRGSETLYGVIAKHDLVANPNLLGWYAKHGFQFEEVEHEHWAGNVLLELAKTQ